MPRFPDSGGTPARARRRWSRDPAGCVSHVWEINEADIQLTNALYPVAQEAMRRGYYMPNRGSIQDAHLELDFSPGLAALDAHRLVLTRKEYELLSLLVENAGEIVPREVLLMRIWGYGNQIRTRTLDVHIRRLRTKLGPTAGNIWRPSSASATDSSRSMGAGAIKPRRRRWH